MAQKRTGRKGLIRKVANAASTPKELKRKYILLNDQYCFLDKVRMYVANENFDYEKYEYEAGEMKDFEREAKLLKESTNFEHAFKVVIDIERLEEYEEEEKKNKKAEKRKITKPYIVKAESFKIGFDSKFLLEFCRFFDTCVIYVISPTAPAYYHNEDGEWGLICPMRIKQED